MSDLPRIPVSWSQRWRSLRQRLFPVCAFALSACLAGWLWSRQFSFTQAIGEVFAHKVEVSVPVDGALLAQSGRNLDLYQTVRAGQVIIRLDDRPTLAAISTVQKQLEEAKLELKAKLEDLRLDRQDREFDRTTEARRLAVEIEQRRLDIASRKGELTADKIELERELEKLKVADELMAKKAISRIDYLEYERRRDVVQERIRGHEEFLAEARLQLQSAQQRMDQHSPTESATAADLVAPFHAAIGVQEARLAELELQREALDIRSPISGRIVSVSAWPGQQVRRGTVVFTVASHEADYIVSYVRPNQRFQPAKGMQVAARSRTNTSLTVSATVSNIGPQLEPIPAQQLRDIKRPEWGLPVLISIPSSLGLRPGELVDLKFLPPDRGLTSQEPQVALPSRRD